MHPRPAPQYCHGVINQGLGLLPVGTLVSKAGEMASYRFYLMVGTMIIAREDAACGSDGEAQDHADRRLRETGATYDAIEVWDGARHVCRTERRVTQ